MSIDTFNEQSVEFVDRNHHPERIHVPKVLNAQRQLIANLFTKNHVQKEKPLESAQSFALHLHNLLTENMNHPNLLRLLRQIDADAWQDISKVIDDRVQNNLRKMGEEFWTPELAKETREKMTRGKMAEVMGQLILADALEKNPDEPWSIFRAEKGYREPLGKYVCEFTSPYNVLLQWKNKKGGKERTKAELDNILFTENDGHGLFLIDFTTYFTQQKMQRDKKLQVVRSLLQNKKEGYGFQIDKIHIAFIKSYNSRFSQQYYDLSQQGEPRIQGCHLICVPRLRAVNKAVEHAVRILEQKGSLSDFLKLYANGQ